MQFSAVLIKEGKHYVALCAELDIASQGENIEEALGNLREAIELYLEDEDAEVPKEETRPLVTLIEVTKVETPRGVRA